MSEPPQIQFPEWAPGEVNRDDAPTRTNRWIVPGLLVIGLLIAVGVYVSVSDTASVEDRYLWALDEADLRDEFAADRQAIKNAEGICKELDDGGRAQGSRADRIGVEHYCDDYLDAFKVLETKVIEGSFTLRDSKMGPSDSGPCSGSGGYSDISVGRGVEVRNDAGDPLGRTKLGPGTKKSRNRCEFLFEVELTEGEDSYVFEVGSRGQIAFTWKELTGMGPHLTLGSS